MDRVAICTNLGSICADLGTDCADFGKVWNDLRSSCANLVACSHSLRRIPAATGNRS